MLESSFFTDLGCKIDLVNNWEGRETPGIQLFSKRFTGKTQAGWPVQVYYEYFRNHAVRNLEIRVWSESLTQYKHDSDAEKTWLQRLFSKTTNNLSPYFNYRLKYLPIKWVEIGKDEAGTYLFFWFSTDIQLEQNITSVFQFLADMSDSQIDNY